MHTLYRLASCLLFLSCIAAAPLAVSQQTRIIDDPSALHLDYTGGLFGYYQINEPDTHLAPVADFFATRKASPSRLLLGMGDNFGPEFRAGIQANSTSSSYLCYIPIQKRWQDLDAVDRYPGAFYKDEDRMPAHNKVECDNVVRFLIQAGYRAVVPGREDFMYTSTWLRSIALGLKERYENQPKDERLLMLSANLRVKWAAEGPIKPPKDVCSLLFEKEPLLHATTCTSGANSTTTTLDWLHRMELALPNASSNTNARETDNHETESLEKTIQHATEFPDKKTSKDTSPEKIQASIAEAAQRRMSLMMNQAAQLEAMLPALLCNTDTPIVASCKDLASALEHLASSKSYELYPNTKPSEALKLSKLKPPAPEQDQSAKSENSPVSGEEALKQLVTALTYCKPADTATEDQKNVLSDFCAFGNELARKLDLGKSGAASNSLLLGQTARRGGTNLLLRVIALEQENKGYTIDGLPGRETLIIGVMGNETLSATSPTNLQLCTLDTSSVSQLPPDPMGVCRRSQTFYQGQGRLKGTVFALDPVQTVDSIIRGVKAQGKAFSQVVVMAQMPRTQAEEMAAQLRKKLLSSGTALSFPILVLSEAQQDHVSPQLDIAYDSQALIPVLTPRPAYDTHKTVLVDPVSSAHIRNHISCACDEDTQLANRSHEFPLPENPDDSGQRHNTTVGLLVDELEKTPPANAAVELIGSPYTGACQGNQTSNVCKDALTKFLLERMQVKSKADVVFVEHRDLFMAALPAGYDNYDVCQAAPDISPNSHAEQACMLRTALDRVLWKGDYGQRVMVSGKDLTTILKMSQQQSAAESSLAARDVSGQWLATFGVVQPIQANLTTLQSSSTAFSIPQDAACNGASTSDSASVYCINGTPIALDAPYWVATTDHIATDSVIYQVLASTIPDYRAGAGNYLTAEIAKSLLRTAPKSATREPETPLVAEAIHQQRSLFHVDVGKVVAGFANRSSDGGNNYVATNFQGSTDTRASTPSQQELDLETQVRVSFDLPSHPHAGRQILPVSFGVQTDNEYDRQATGNLTNKPVNGVYSLNNSSVGGFMQIRLPEPTFLHPHRSEAGGRGLPRTLLVLSPRQFQTQINGNFLFFPFTVGSGETTVHIPKGTSLFDKVGLRREEGGGEWWIFDKGSYAELGFENGVQNNVLASLTLATQGEAVPPPCLSSSSVPIPTCFKNYATSYKFTIDQTTQVVGLPGTTSLHLMGAYWDIHAQKGISRTADKSGPGVNFTFDSKGDWFTPKRAGRALSTQQTYAIPLAMALNFPIFRNVTLSPTYSLFLYATQVTGESLVQKTFSISAKWYFAHDSSVPVDRQIYFQGPASADQTKTSKIK